jgi:hypothetical protein
MPESIDNYKLRAALLEHGFKDITSQNRSTKSWKLHHPRMQHWISIKLAEKIEQPMAKAPLVIHPADARRVQPLLGSESGVVFEPEPYKGTSTKYDGGVLGRAISLADLAAVEAFIAAATGMGSPPNKKDVGVSEPGPASVQTEDTASDDVDPILLSAAAAEVDADIAGQDVSATTRQRLIEARLGQGQYRSDMIRIWGGVAPSRVAALFERLSRRTQLPGGMTRTPPSGWTPTTACCWLPRSTDYSTEG